MFVVSKLLSAITQPIFWMGLRWVLALLILGLNSRWYRPALGMLWTGLAILAGLGLTAIPDALLRPLENRYPVPAPQEVARHAGIMVWVAPPDTLICFWRMARCHWVKPLSV